MQEVLHRLSKNWRREWYRRYFTMWHHSRMDTNTSGKVFQELLNYGLNTMRRKVTLIRLTHSWNRNYWNLRTTSCHLYFRFCYLDMDIRKMQWEKPLLMCLLRYQLHIQVSVLGGYSISFTLNKKALSTKGMPISSRLSLEQTSHRIYWIRSLLHVKHLIKRSWSVKGSL
jgi:hypothetical protein